MEDHRLTFRHDCPGLSFHERAESCEPITCIDEYSQKALDEVINRLAAYEDLGTVEELTEKLQQLERYSAKMGLVKRK